MNNELRSGFTLIEILIVLGIAAALSTVGFMSLSSFRGARGVRAGIQELESVLTDARERARTGEEGSAWGVRFSNPLDGVDRYELFRGNLYDSESVERLYRLPSGVMFFEPAEGEEFDIVFSPVSGETSEDRIVSVFHSAAPEVVGEVLVQTFGLIHARYENP